MQKAHFADPKAALSGCGVPHRYPPFGRAKAKKDRPATRPPPPHFDLEGFFTRSAPSALILSAPRSKHAAHQKEAREFHVDS
ncbi:hypothetical protein [Hydrogenophaga sp.]|uniref:hypothetical protein n=1 Tax=Hydrogenophaga sp. TaxID=1904254 RepID=UPI00271D8D07|nr:hypothetical protein [Hydrogenophaga sp.]MDO9437878.1 hypothetical protein [Hydrogenophaga sp.]